jgi:hypothetical protein
MASGFRIITDNYIDDDVYNTITPSSEQSGYEVENIEAKTYRQANWRTDGFFEVTASNKTIVFQETDGVDLTATLAEGNITSRSAMSTAIKTALDAAGGDTYTVTRVDEKFVITSDGSFLRIDGTDGSHTAGDLIGFTTNQSTATPATGLTADVVRIHTEEYIEIDFGVAKRPSAIMLTGDRGDTLKLSPTATVKLQMNTTNVWTAPLVDETLTVGDDYVYKLEDDYFDSSYYRYARIYIEDKDNGNGYIQINVAALGEQWNLVRGRAQFPFSENYIDNSVITVNKDMTYYAEERTKLYRYNVKMSALKKAAKEELQDFFEDYGITKPFMVSIDTDQAFSSSAERLMKLVRFSSNIDTALISKDFFDCTLNLVEVL